MPAEYLDEQHALYFWFRYIDTGGRGITYTYDGLFSSENDHTANDRTRQQVKHRGCEMRHKANNESTVNERFCSRKPGVTINIATTGKGER